jgi:hypothetical protein
MPNRPSRARPFGALFQRLQQPGVDRKALQDAAQLALRVEFSTIPVYLTGMYSIQDPASAPYQALRAVVMEEMFHVNQAANLVVALGALPCFTGEAAPVYPGYLPHANPATTPLLGLMPASTTVFEQLYAAIEWPAPSGAPAQLDQYDTIAQLYEALKQAIERYDGNPFDAPAPEGRQRDDIYLGKYGGTVLKVHDVAGALRAIEEIVKQGEGSVPPGSPLVPIEAYGTYNQYGQRSDGTYGPILGTPYELSHFSRFRQVALSKEAFPQTRPIVSNPHEKDFSNPAAKKLSHTFNGAYSTMLKLFELSFRVGPDPYFGLVLELMHHVLPKLALSLMTTPALEDGNADTGPTATPTWTWLPDAKWEHVGHQLHELHQAPPPGLPAAARQHVRGALDGWQRLVTTQALPAL